MPRRKMQSGAGFASSARTGARYAARGVTSAARSVGAAAYRGANWVHNNPQTIRRVADELRSGAKSVRLGLNSVVNHPSTRIAVGMAGVGAVDNYMTGRDWLDRYNAIAEPAGFGRKRRKRVAKRK